ncbi:response regulator transcription factor [Paenibacillus athensensis]|uniref:DNA-binding response regulator n=1 Tax=Paenibacillus athensensis TaxID=1967502 RepID=A0A4Y8PYE1_9BACL|nr:response regulator transcription factor [Paenibacillus athensensis]MCD1259945.1 response regulator transcription factor [Paenibacillus athensensis]
MSAVIMVVDDEVNMIDVCTRYLEREGYRVVSASNGADALQLWRQHTPDLIVLDLMMPGKSGWQVCEEIRNEQDVPIVMLTARGEETDRVMGLTMGADDYLTKPFSPRELVLRVKAILRRQQRTVRPEQPGGGGAAELAYPGLIIHTLRRTVEAQGREVELTVKEFELLQLLAAHPEQVFSRNQLLNHVWDTDYYGDTTTVTVHIRRLREKIEPNPSQPRYIKTVWGIGYKFEGRDLS